jgi:hypothetical protein
MGVLRYRANAIGEVVQTCKDLDIRSLHDSVEVIEQEPEHQEPRSAGPKAEVASLLTEGGEEAEGAEVAKSNGEPSTDTGPFSGYSPVLCPPLSMSPAS